MRAMFIICYCCVCERETSHKHVKDNIFEYGLKCMVCKTVWEANNPNEVKDTKLSDREMTIEKYGDKGDI